MSLVIPSKPFTSAEIFICATTNDKVLIRVDDLFSRRMKIDEAEKLLKILQGAISVARNNSGIIQITPATPSQFQLKCQRCHTADAAVIVIFLDHGMERCVNNFMCEKCYCDGKDIPQTATILRVKFSPHKP